MRKLCQFFVFQLVLVGYGQVAESDTLYLSGYSSEIQSLLAGFEESVSKPDQIQDLYEVAIFLSTTSSSQIPNDWKQRFCDAQKNYQFEYIIATKSIENVPLIIKQIDSTNDGDALVPHNLVVDGHNSAVFSISSVEKYKHLKFSKWSDECVPFLFEIESEKIYVKAAKSGKTNAGIYFIAAICRGKKISLVRNTEF